jgi:serine-type D-Ala-D-Ala carboxypeptidase/endopeptidase
MLFSQSGSLLVALAGTGIMALGASPRTLAAQATFPAESAVRTLMRDAVAAGRAVGIVVGLLEADGTRRILSEGSSGIKGRPLDGHSVFEVGSITKVFTGTLLADMVDRGEVRLDDPIEKLLPPGGKVGSRKVRRATLLDLATHYSGFPLVPTNLVPTDPANPYVDYPVDSIHAFLATFNPPRAPGRVYEYSNFGVGLLGHLLALRARTDFELLLRRRILLPLGLSETAITLTPAMLDRLTQGHGDFGDPVPNWDFPSLPGAGALRSTAADLLTFAAANLAAPQGILGEAMRDALTPRRAAEAGDSTASDSIGLNWFTSHGKQRRITSHRGGTGGYRSFIGLDVDARRAVVVLTNSAGDGCADIGLHLLDPAIPLAPLPVGLEVVRRYRAGGLTEAITRYRELRRPASPGWRFDQYELNTVGYWLLAHGRVEDAVQIFRLNVEEYPGESNPYDSLGEALLAAGDTAAAIRNYERSVQLDPSNAGGLAVLRRLKAR